MCQALTQKAANTTSSFSYKVSHIQVFSEYLSNNCRFNFLFMIYNSLLLFYCLHLLNIFIIYRQAEEFSLNVINIIIYLCYYFRIWDCTKNKNIRKAMFSLNCSFKRYVGWLITSAMVIYCTRGFNRSRYPFKVEYDPLHISMSELRFEPNTSCLVATGLNTR